MHKVSDEKQASLYRSINRFLRKKGVITGDNVLKFGSYVEIATLSRFDDTLYAGYVGGTKHGTKGPAIFLLTEEPSSLPVPGLTVDWDVRYKTAHMVDWCWIKSVNNNHDVHLLLTSQHAAIQQLGIALLKEKENEHST